MIKAIIPVAGVGTRLRPHTHTQPKPLIPLAGKAILAHIIDSIYSSGIRDFVFIIGHLGEKIETYLNEKYKDKINIEIVVQSPRRGLGHALYMAREEIRQCDEILISLGDTIFDVELDEIIQSNISTVGVQVVEDPRDFGVAIVDEDHLLVDAVEKPRIPKSNLALVGLYKILEIPEFIDALEELMKGKTSHTGEYHLTQGLKILLKKGVKIKASWVDNWFDCGRKETLLETNRILLERMPTQKKYRFHNTVIIPPVHISKKARIKNSIVGPFVSIDEFAEVNQSILENSILGAYSQLASVIMRNSVIGTDASLRGKPHSVNIGDSNEIDFNE